MATTSLVDELIEELERLPAHPSVAMKVVWVADDPSASSDDLAAAVSADPTLTARVLKLANSAYYGLSGRVANVGFAVTVIGFPTVRAMAAAAASGLFEPGEQVASPGFWRHAAVVATACSTLADRFGVRRADAFSLGLLHDLGEALLFRCDPVRYEQVAADPGPLPLPERQRQAFGLAHDEAAARVFATWQFPEEFVRAVAEHHQLLGRADNAHARLLAAAEACAARLPEVSSCDLTGGRDDPLARAGVGPEELAALDEQVAAAATDLLAVLDAGVEVPAPEAAG